MLTDLLAGVKGSHSEEFAMAEPAFTVIRAPARPEPMPEPPELLSLEEEARLQVHELPAVYDGAEPTVQYFGGARPSAIT